MYHGDDKGKDFNLSWRNEVQRKPQASVHFGKEYAQRAASDFDRRGNSRGSASGIARDLQGRPTSNELSGGSQQKNQARASQRSETGSRREVSVTQVGWGRVPEEGSSSCRQEHAVTERERMEFLRHVDTRVVQNRNGTQQSGWTDQWPASKKPDASFSWKGRDHRNPPEVSAVALYMHGLSN